MLYSEYLNGVIMNANRWVPLHVQVNLIELGPLPPLLGTHVGGTHPSYIRVLFFMLSVKVPTDGNHANSHA